jgi:hypothetical protein
MVMGNKKAPDFGGFLRFNHKPLPRHQLPRPFLGREKFVLVGLVGLQKCCTPLT